MPPELDGEIGSLLDAGSPPDPKAGEDKGDGAKTPDPGVEAINVLREENAKLREQVTEVVARVLETQRKNGNSEDLVRAVESQPPNSREKLKKLVADGDTEGFVSAMEENSEWRTKRASEETVGRVREQGRIETLDKYIASALGLNGTDAKWDARLKEETTKVMNDLPFLDEARAKIIAAGAIARKGNPAPDIDLRRETTQKTSSKKGTGGPGPAAPSAEIDFEAPNRGFSEEEQDTLRTYRLGHLLERSSDPKEEARRRYRLRRIRQTQRDIRELSGRPLEEE